MCSGVVVIRSCDEGTKFISDTQIFNTISSNVFLQVVNFLKCVSTKDKGCCVLL